MDWNMDSILNSFSSFLEQNFRAVLWLGTTQESPLQQLVDLQGNLALLQALGNIIDKRVNGIGNAPSNN